MSEDALRQLLPVIASPLFLMPFLVVLVGAVAYIAWIAEKERERVEQLADRLRRLCQSAGRPAIRRRRPRLMPLDVPAAILSVDRSLRALERDRGIRSRRLPPHLLFLEHKTLIDNLEQRVSKLEGRGLR